MRILVTGHHNPLYLTFVEYFEDAVKKTGHKLISFDDRQFLFPGRLRHWINTIQNLDLILLNNKLYKQAKKHIPDLVIINQGHYVLKETVIKFQNLGIPIVLWVIDPPNNFIPIADAAPYYNHVFCGGTEAIEILKDQGLKNLTWLPFACEPEFHFPRRETNNNEVQLKKDVVFVGSHYPSRERIFESLDVSTYSFGIWGSGWDKITSGSPIKKNIQKTHTRPDEWIKIYSNSKIVLVTHYSEIKDMPCYQASPKLYEALACGAFVICNEQKDAQTLFKNREHLVFFQNIKDLNEKIGYYLGHPDERNRIAKNGQNEAITKHTYIHRLNKMLNTLHEKGIIP